MDKTGVVFIAAPVFSFEARKEAHMSADTGILLPNNLWKTGFREFSS